MRLASFIDGVQAYQEHPYRRVMPDPSIVWIQGTTRILNFGSDRNTNPILIVPSLVNRYYILDLNEKHSFVRWLADRGFCPLIVDWGMPGPSEQNFSLCDYIKRLDCALDWVTNEMTCSAVTVIGYCMGGLLAMSMSLRNMRKVKNLVLLATPWDFSSSGMGKSNVIKAVYPSIEALINFFGELPTDILQIFFAGLDPLLVERKFVSFSKKNPEESDAISFVAIEDWVNDGVPLVAQVARECFYDWYIKNSPSAGTWKVDGNSIDPSRFDKPTLLVVPTTDQIVPPGSAIALAQALPRATLHRPLAGHVGMVVGSSAKEEMWKPVAKWLSAV